VDVQCTLKEVPPGESKTPYRLLRESLGGLGARRQSPGRRESEHFAFLTTTAGTERPVQLVVDNPKKALENAALSSEADVLHVELPNVAGALASLGGKLGAKEINITCGYATGVKGPKKASVELAVPDLDKAARVR
jgi:hypothetical protein